MTIFYPALAVIKVYTLPILLVFLILIKYTQVKGMAANKGVVLGPREERNDAGQWVMHLSTFKWSKIHISIYLIYIPFPIL